MDSSSTQSGRRPSLDTVSTYLSQESRESQATASTADLINCSGSDDGVEIDNVSLIVGKKFNCGLLQVMQKLLLVDNRYLLFSSTCLENNESSLLFLDSYCHKIWDA